MKAEGLSRRACSSGKAASPSISAKNRPPSGPNKPVCATNEPKDQTGKERWGRNEGGGGRCKNKRTEGERSGVIGYWGYRDKRWPKCSAYSCPKAIVCLHLVPKLLSPKSLGTWKGRSASLCLLGKLSSLLSSCGEWEAVELSSLQRDL